jgi:hypothetical protein
VYFCLIVLLLLEPGAVDAPGGAFGHLHSLVLEGLEACDVKSE